MGGKGDKLPKMDEAKGNQMSLVSSNTNSTSYYPAPQQSPTNASGHNNS